MKDIKKLVFAYLIFFLFCLVILIIGRLTSGGICMIYNLVGIPCPSCGMTRAFVNLLNFNITDAFRINPAFPLVILFPYIYVKKSKIMLIIVITLFILIWIVRMFLYYPDVQPMTPNNDAFIYKLFMEINFK